MLNASPERAMLGLANWPVSGVQRRRCSTPECSATSTRITQEPNKRAPATPQTTIIRGWEGEAESSMLSHWKG